MENKPVKRSKYIVELSKDHHSGLLFCWKIREGLKKNIALYRIRKYINFFWGNHLKTHFAEEESLLLNHIDDTLCQQAKQEHLMLKARLDKLNYYENEEREEYVLFEELLTRHIRFEERILFPHLEASLPVETLQQAGDFLAGHHTAPFVDSYLDEFWTKTKDE